MSDGDFVKVRFRLERDAEGWPPVASEGVWARPLGGGRYQVENTPWFVRNLANGDVVRAQPDADGALWAMERVEWSGWGTIRVIPRPDGPLAGSLAAVLEEFGLLDVSGEGLEQYGIVALEIPPDADLGAIKDRLASGERSGLWYFEEGCVSQAWLDA